MNNWNEWFALIMEAKELGMTPEEVMEVLERIKQENKQ
ncbi:anti-repressor SinI family protein [Metabacillus arenae]|nr:anti-repressor SinI family protein [Metabacillus arenae]